MVHCSTHAATGMLQCTSQMPENNRSEHFTIRRARHRDGGASSSRRRNPGRCTTRRSCSRPTPAAPPASWPRHPHGAALPGLRPLRSAGERCRLIAGLHRRPARQFIRLIQRPFSICLGRVAPAQCNSLHKIQCMHVQPPTPACPVTRNSRRDKRDGHGDFCTTAHRSELRWPMQAARPLIATDSNRSRFRLIPQCNSEVGRRRIHAGIADHADCIGEASGPITPVT